MGEFNLKIAGHTGRFRCLFDSTPVYLGAYVTRENPEFFCCVTREDLEKQQYEAEQEAIREGFRYRKFTDPFLERAVIQQKMAEYLFDRDILLFHGSTVAVDNRAYLFTAHSGTGKSTHTRLWRERFGSRAVMVNDDKPFLKLESGRVVAFGAPWSGKHGLDSNISVPLAGICILERGRENRICRITPEDAMEMLKKQCFSPDNLENQEIFLDKVQRLASLVPLYRMHCNKEPEAAECAYEGMKKPES